MIIWTVANQKGGVGKTTTAISLAGLMIQRGYKVLLVDMDPHCSLSYYLGIDAESLEYSAFDVFIAGKTSTTETVKQSIYPTNLEGLDIMPANMAMATLDRKFGSTEGMGLILQHALKQLSNEYDAILIDCPPVLGVLMVNALAASDRILVPVQTEFLALKGLERMIKSLQIMKSSPNQNVDYLVVPTMFDRRTKASIQAMKALQEHYGDAVWRSVIPIDTRFRDASLANVPPSFYAAKTRGVLAYKDLLNDLLDYHSSARAKK